MRSRLDVATREADNLAVLQHRRAATYRLEGELVSHAHPPIKAQCLAVNLNLHPFGQMLRRDGDVVLRAESDGNLSERHGSHEIQPEKDRTGTRTLPIMAGERKPDSSRCQRTTCGLR